MRVVLVCRKRSSLPNSSGETTSSYLLQRTDNTMSSKVQTFFFFERIVSLVVDTGPINLHTM